MYKSAFGMKQHNTINSSLS